MEGWVVDGGSDAARPGRPAARPTTQDHITDVAIDLFATYGFGEVSVDDVALAAGIARRTLFRYYPSKNAIPWGDFDAHLRALRAICSTTLDPSVPIGDGAARRHCWRSTPSTTRRPPGTASACG